MHTFCKCQNASERKFKQITAELPDGIDGEDLLDAVLLEPMAFERVLLLLHFWRRVQVLHGHTTLDARHNVALLVGDGSGD